MFEEKRTNGKRPVRMMISAASSRARVDRRSVSSVRGRDRQQIVGKLPPDHRGDLRQLTAMGDPVEPLHQGIVQGLRHPGGADGVVPSKPPFCGRALPRSAEDARCQFLDEQRHAFGPVDNLVEDLLGQAAFFRHLLDHPCHFAAR